jgi:hypothetical protein
LPDGTRIIAVEHPTVGRPQLDPPESRAGQEPPLHDAVHPGPCRWIAPHEVVVEVGLDDGQAQDLGDPADVELRFSLGGPPSHDHGRQGHDDQGEQRSDAEPHERTAGRTRSGGRAVPPVGQHHDRGRLVQQRHHHPSSPFRHVNAMLGSRGWQPNPDRGPDVTFAAPGPPLATAWRAE